MLHSVHVYSYVRLIYTTWLEGSSVGLYRVRAIAITLKLLLLELDWVISLTLLENGL